jgi:hypothetical protein
LTVGLIVLAAVWISPVVLGVAEERTLFVIVRELFDGRRGLVLAQATEGWALEGLRERRSRAV